MSEAESYTLFTDGRRLAKGDIRGVAIAAKTHADSSDRPMLALSDTTGRPVDFDLRGSVADVEARYAPAAAPQARSGRGRPKLGVTAREVTLLPRHWDWLSAQPGGASAALRRLVDQARRDNPDRARRLQAQEAAHRVITVLAGDLPDYEDALRAFYAGDVDGFQALVEPWPPDIRAYVLEHARAAWGGGAPD
ncbi:MAG TPA: DUF2239 family protein [Phenylobacterium sp.]|nr:DUF2239 family protein [Phenylobacterium sp.]